MNSHRHGLAFASTPRPRPRPRSLHELPSYHVEMPLLPFDQLQPMGPWTPGTPEDVPRLLRPHLNLINSSMYQAEPFERRSRSPGYTTAFDVTAEYGERARSTSRTPSRRHTLESSSGLFGTPSNNYARLWRRAVPDPWKSATTPMIPGQAISASMTLADSLVGRIRTFCIGTSQAPHSGIIF